ncbi:MAG: sigma-70 family RNA polymerase sigma factor [bacterium]|nr:sigma-70 family RNA polymerase sigma factor [bacterium]
MQSDAYLEGGSSHDRWDDLVARHLAGDHTGTEELARELDPALRTAARGMLGADDRDADDVVSESVVAVLDYLRRQGSFDGNLLVFGIAVTRNRCRNLQVWRQRRPQVPLESLTDWLAHPGRNPLDALVDRERLELLQEALNRLGPECRELLRAWYLEGVAVEEIRRRLGLRSIQGVYYRRTRCLEKAGESLNDLLSGCSSHAGTRPAHESPKEGSHE